MNILLFVLPVVLSFFRHKSIMASMNQGRSTNELAIQRSIDPHKKIITSLFTSLFLTNYSQEANINNTSIIKGTEIYIIYALQAVALY